MSKLITQIKRFALALCLATPFVSWAATAPSITVDGANVTVHNDNGTAWDNAAISAMSSYQDTTFTIPSGTGLASDAKVLVSSISIGCSSSQPGYMPAKLSLTVGDTTYVSKTATVTAGGFTSSGKNKYTYSFDGKYCILTVGTAASLKWINEDGSEMQGYAAFGLVKQGHQFISRIAWSGSVPVTEVTGKIVTVATGALTDIYNTDTTPKCLQDATGWISTATASTGEITLVNGPAGYALSVNNANSLADDNPNRVSVWKKLSGDGTLTTSGANNVAPVIEVFDSSEFIGTITSSGTPKLSVIFCNEGETLTDEDHTTLYSLINWQRLIYVSAGRTAANNAVVTVPAGKTWTAANGLKNYGETVVDGTFDGPIVNEGTLTINGSITGTVSGSGTVVVNEGATLASFGSVRDFTGFSVDSSVAVKITMTAEEYGKGSLSVTGASGISSITVLAPDGTSVVTTLTPENGEATYNRGTVLVSGKACTYDYEMTYVANETTGFENSGTAGTSLHSDGNVGADAFNSVAGTLYTYAHPYLDGISYPDKWSAMVRCTVPKAKNGVVVMFGTWFDGAIGLIAGDDPEKEMYLVRTPGYNTIETKTSGCMQYSVLAEMQVSDATTAAHTFLFTMNEGLVKVYCDGQDVLPDGYNFTGTLGVGMQIGSLHGGVARDANYPTGLIRFWKGDTYTGLETSDLLAAQIDAMRIYDYLLSDSQLAALRTEFPPMTAYRCTISEAADDYVWSSAGWNIDWDNERENKAITLMVNADATVTLPAAITANTLTINIASGKTLTLSGSSTLQIDGTGNLIEVNGGKLNLTGALSLNSDVVLNGSLIFDGLQTSGDGTLKIAAGATVSAVTATVVTPLGSYTCAEGTVVDSDYAGEGVVRLIPLASARASLMHGGETYYYSTHDNVFMAFMQVANQDDTAVLTILDGTDYSASADQFATYGYVYDATANTLVKAMAKFLSDNKWKTYSTLADAFSEVADGGTVYLLRACNEAITLSNKAITLSETANFSGTLSGNGTLTFAAVRNNPSITFSDWTGTVVLPAFTASGVNLNGYGTVGSTIALTEITSGWINPDNASIAAALRLDGPVNITAMSTRAYVFAEIGGTNNLSFATAGDQPSSVTITKVTAGYAGVISSTSTLEVPVTITTLEREAGTSTDAGTKLLSTSGNVVVLALKIGNEPAEVELVTKDDGVYIIAPVAYTITTSWNYDDPSNPYTVNTTNEFYTLDAAIASNATKIYLYDNTLDAPNDWQKTLENGTYVLTPIPPAAYVDGMATANAYKVFADAIAAATASGTHTLIVNSDQTVDTLTIPAECTLTVRMQDNVSFSLTTATVYGTLTLSRGNYSGASIVLAGEDATCTIMDVATGVTSSNVGTIVAGKAIDSKSVSGGTQYYHIAATGSTVKINGTVATVNTVDGVLSVAATMDVGYDGAAPTDADVVINANGKDVTLGFNINDFTATHKHGTYTYDVSFRASLKDPFENATAAWTPASEGKIKLGVSVVPGLFYGVTQGETLGDAADGTPTMTLATEDNADTLLVVDEEDGASGFYKVWVSDEE